MNNNQQKGVLFNYLEGQADNGSIQVNLINQSQPSKNMSGDENSSYGEKTINPQIL